MKKNALLILFALLAGACLAQGTLPMGRPRNLLNRATQRNGRGPAAQQQAEAANAAAEDAVKNAPKGTNGVPALVFDKAPMELVLKAYGDLVQKTIIPAPDLPKADITLKKAIELNAADARARAEAYVTLARNSESSGDAKSAVVYATAVVSLFDDDELCAEARRILEAHPEVAK